MAVCAAREWEYSVLCLELLPASLLLELRQRLPSLPWALAVVPPSTEEVLPSAEEVPPVDEEEEVVAPAATRTAKGKGKVKAIEESHPEKVPHLRSKKSPQQIEVGPHNERPLSRKGCLLSAGVVSNAEHLQVDAECHSVPSGLRAHVLRTRVEIVDEGDDAPSSLPEVAPRSLSGSSGSGLPAPDPTVTATRSRSHQAVPVMDNAEAGLSKSTPVGEKRPRDKAEGMPPFKCVHFQVPEFGNQVFDANDPSQLLGVVALIPTRPPPPPSAPASEDRSLQERVTAMEACQAHLEAHIGALEHNGQVFQAWVTAQQYENQAFRHMLDAHTAELREMVAALMHTIDQDRSSTAQELQRGCLFWSTAYPTLHLVERYFQDHPSACMSPLKDYPVYGCTGETEERSEAACDHELTGEDGGEDVGERHEEEESEGWGLNDDEHEYMCSLARFAPTDAIRRPRSSSAESTDHSSYGEPEDAKREDSGDECDCALVVDEDESDDSSSSVDLSEEEANALIAKYAPPPVVPSIL
ncbi:hypothetical protein NEOLEDRAFT_1180132 [Neolentinus lepideus HHB14362 ss-1]|uniref:Uncharacterized protein n=1 Tax=Neolentinus lepideus HHB14362 ss-1 TaxID=1314782 RepID=A0A165R9F1_9AGAM|nr:hypothetical protein NEOLEDRAFT_1180132 [Neolentinus lepideus HHB14362 ss-1]